MKFGSVALALCLFSQASAAELAAPFAQPDQITATDSRVSLPAGASAREDYVRFYLPMFVTSADDLPFTTFPGGFHLKPGLIVVGLFVTPGNYGVAGPPGIRLVTAKGAFPYAVHGGCRAINAVIDAKTGATLGSWCNVDEDQPLPPHRVGGSARNEGGAARHGSVCNGPKITPEIVRRRARARLDKVLRPGARRYYEPYTVTRERSGWRVEGTFKSHGDAMGGAPIVIFSSCGEIASVLLGV
jgi:hypothetical protein